MPNKSNFRKLTTPQSLNAYIKGTRGVKRKLGR